MKLEDLKTPCAIVDLDVVEANISRMASRMSRLGVRLRPHVKTHKCIEAARLQVHGHFGGLTVSTTAEAGFFAAAGFRDITYAAPIAASRMADAAELTRSLDSFHILLDHEKTMADLEECARSQGIRFSVLLKVDCGYHRAGVDPNREESVSLAAMLAASPHIDFRGLLTHAGHAYRCRNAGQIEVIARQERDVMTEFAGKLRCEGVNVAEVSVGSTPTMSVADDLEGVTEARPGNYVFHDRFQAAIGSCRLADAALSILTSVVCQYPKHNRLLIDAGGLSFSRDPGPTHMDSNCGYGAFFSLCGNKTYPDLRLKSISQEIGKVTGVRPLDFDTFRIGRKLRVIPNHACLTAALHDRFYVFRGDEVVDEWKPVRGWDIPSESS